MLSNCELPAQLLSRSEELNDYDFVLFHLMEKNKVYRDYFSQVMKEGKRMTILDNSAYEFYRDGGSLNEEAFEKMVEELNPTYFIVPDVLMDAKTTLENYEKWKGRLKNHRRMVVPQGKSLKEWLDCYDVIVKDPAVDCIGIPFHNDFFWGLGLATSTMTGVQAAKEDPCYSQGRLFLLYYLKESNRVDPSKKYHLLGTHDPREKSTFEKGKEINSWITSIDSSYPVTKGIKLKDLNEGPKEKISIDDFFEMDLSKDQVDKIVNNIKNFKNDQEH